MEADKTNKFLQVMAEAAVDQSINRDACLAAWDLVGPGGGCSIPDTALRGITPDQLERPIQHVKQRLDRGEVLSYTPNYPGAPVRTIRHIEEVNLYDLDALVIRPATKARQCSMVCMIPFIGYLA